MKRRKEWEYWSSRRTSTRY